MLKKNDIVLYRPISDMSEGKLYIVHDDSYVTNGNEVVFLIGYRGYVLVSHCTVIDIPRFCELRESVAPSSMINVDEFVKEGYLHEANRQFFHPHGLALTVGSETPGGPQYLVGLQDHRDDPEGVYYGDIDQGKIDNIKNVLEKRSPARKERLGYVIQPGGDNGKA